MSNELPPRGSGYYAVIVGLFFLFALIISFWVTIDLLTRQWLMRIWLLFVSTSLFLWGINRITKSRPDATIGQDTINLVNGIFSSTIALLALLFGK
jgi:high-affinity Fe2+/Pb2+ permease